jgi:orotate phosphoribosyltransferase
MAVALLEDLAATGTSLLRCCEIVQGLGARVVSLYAVVDREQGTRERLAAYGLRYRPLITFSELVQHAPETGGAC